MDKGTRRALRDCSVGADVILPNLGPATVIQRSKAQHKEGDVTVVVEGDRLGKKMCLRGGLMVIDTGLTSSNLASNASS